MVFHKRITGKDYINFIIMNKGRRVYIDQIMACCIYPFTASTKPGGMDAPGVISGQSQHTSRTVGKVLNTGPIPNHGDRSKAVVLIGSPLTK